MQVEKDGRSDTEVDSESEEDRAITTATNGIIDPHVNNHKARQNHK